MITARPSHERGHAQHGWLDSYHSFAFADYHDPAHLHWGPLRVINEDRVAPGEGFPPHGHRDMEIISYVLSGTLEHKDNLGNSSLIRPGEIQRMSAGQGVVHSEYNPSQTEPLHFLQIWIMPAVHAVVPGYAQQPFTLQKDKWSLLISEDGADGSIAINQDVRLYTARISEGDTLDIALPPHRLAYLHVARGAVRLQGQRFGSGDGAKIRDEEALSFLGANGDAEVLLFDLPLRY